MFRAIVFVLFVSGLSAFGQNSDNTFLYNLLHQNPKQFKDVLIHKKTYEVQIMYTQIDRDENNIPHFKTFTFDVDNEKYFYPASTVKLPVSLLALEKLNEIHIPLLTERTIMYHDSVYSGHITVHKDTTAEGGVPSVEHYIKKIFVASDNDAFNRLYEFVGQKEINRKLTEKGYVARIIHRLNRKGTLAQNRNTEAVRFFLKDSIIYTQHMLTNDSIILKDRIFKGRGYYEDGKLFRKPFELTYRNYFNIVDQHEMLKALIFPKAELERKAFAITSEQRNLVLKYMSQLPTETLYPSYYKDTTMVDAFGKLFMFGSEAGRIPQNVRIFNKLGVAYGYAIDNAYVVDFESGIEFLLTAVIYTNKNQIFNDDTYEYWTVGFPFMKNLGRVIYEYEKSRPKKFTPDLSEFKFSYELSR